MSKRAIRRHHRQRLFRKRLEYYGGWLKESPRARMMINTAKLCSCCGCSCNWERRHMGHVTRQERLAELQEQEERQELKI